MRRALSLWLLLLPIVPMLARGQSPEASSSALRSPRLPVVAETAWTAEQRQLVAEFSPGARPTNDLRTWLAHPDLVRGVMPFAAYVTGRSTLPPPDRALLVLRTAWLARSEYLWAKHAPEAARAGLTPATLARIPVGPSATGWEPFQATLLRAADELHQVSFVSDATWKSLADRYTRHQLMDAVFTVAEFTMLAGVVNSAGTPIDAKFTDRMPPIGPRPVPASRSHVPLAAPRIPPLAPSAMTPEVRAMLDPRGSGRTPAAVYRTFAQHPALYPPRQILSEYIRLKNTLPARAREMLILRIGYLCGSEYEWAAHERAGRAAGLTSEEIQRLARAPGSPTAYEGWSASDAVLVRAVDELFADDVISDRTWSELAARLDTRGLLDLLITTGGYRMVSMALNTFGVPLDL